MGRPPKSRVHVINFRPNHAPDTQQPGNYLKFLSFGNPPPRLLAQFFTGVVGISHDFIRTSRPVATSFSIIAPKPLESITICSYHEKGNPLTQLSHFTSDVLDPRCPCYPDFGWFFPLFSESNKGLGGTTRLHQGTIWVLNCVKGKNMGLSGSASNRGLKVGKNNSFIIDS